MTTRRRFISILAGAAAFQTVGSAVMARPTSWHGIALGANAQIILDHPNADVLIARAIGEIQRLERIFSLYDSESQLSQLNRDGVLPTPAFEMIELLSTCSTINSRTNGAFDPTIQSLWALYAQSYAAGINPESNQIAQALSTTGWHHVQFSPTQVSVAQKGVMLSLNGIAQGYIADKVAAMFRGAGVENVLVNTGEIVAVGSDPEGAGWPVGLAGKPDMGTIPLENASIATSAPMGTTFDALARISHILDPRTGLPAGQWHSVSVIAESAAIADGLSTAFCLMSDAEIQAAKGNEIVYLS